MKRVHLEITVDLVPNRKPYKYTACGRSLGGTCHKLDAVPDFRAVTCIKCQLSDSFYEQKEAFCRSAP